MQHVTRQSWCKVCFPDFQIWINRSWHKVRARQNPDTTFAMFKLLISIWTKWKIINWTASKERLKAYTKLNFQLLSLLSNDRSDANTTVRFQNYFCYCADVFCFCFVFFTGLCCKLVLVLVCRELITIRTSVNRSVWG